MSQVSTASQTSSGVDALIARMRDEGVAAGRREAERLVAEAQAHAREILEKAEASAKTQTSAAATEAAALRRAGEEALRMAARDTILEIKERLARKFAGEVSKAVAIAMSDEELLKRMILAVAGRAREEGGTDGSAELEVDLPRAVVGLDELRRNPEGIKPGSLMHFVAATAGDMLREGVVFARNEQAEGGIRVKLKDSGVSIDLTDRAVAEQLLAHLQPRFRALIEGAVG